MDWESPIFTTSLNLNIISSLHLDIQVYGSVVFTNASHFKHAMGSTNPDFAWTLWLILLPSYFKYAFAHINPDLGLSSKNITCLEVGKARSVQTLHFHTCKALMKVCFSWAFEGRSICKHICCTFKHMRLPLQTLICLWRDFLKHVEHLEKCDLHLWGDSQTHAFALGKPDLGLEFKCFKGIWSTHANTFVKPEFGEESFIPTSSCSKFCSLLSK